jgi:hypothetical protein
MRRAFAFRFALALRSPKGEVGCRLTQAAWHVVMQSFFFAAANFFPG